MRHTLGRLAVLLAAVLGLLATSAGAAHALMGVNHSEPVRLRAGVS